ncbi:MAG TPA: hypothetical protein VGF95_05055 [Solirubrobacteraceae bacterium]|jgi:hypothetical protein
MTTFEQLPPDQRATLSLLLRKHKTYAEVGAMLEISPDAVHDRAHAALAVLAPGLARELDPALRAEVGDYLLGQLETKEAQRTRARISTSAAARKWARALAVELVHVTADQLPEIPDDAGTAPAGEAKPEPEPEPERVGRPGVSRRGGLALLGALAVIIVVAIVLILSGGKGKGPSEPSAAQTSGSKGAETESSEAGEHRDAVLPLKAAESGSSAQGAVEIITRKKQDLFALAGNHLEPSEGNGFFYAVWLLDPNGQTGPTGYEAPAVGAKGELSAAGVLPKNAANYTRIEVTRQTSPDSKQPGTVVLEGVFRLHE